ncbi:chemotaxis protein CheD [Kurthia senegalensis]|uniref:chemotaxis protein CheD n=1 Tax=Kurthia senegalensis TaxID=1033740 RepID=UPI00028865F6|nr:chemotaxis protein CheD [Kurthia senegalensis]
MLTSVDVVKVGIAQLDIATTTQRIRTSGLGSCVGVVLYDEIKQIAGLVHVMLPDSSLSRGNQLTVAKFADTGVPALVQEMQKKGASTFRLKAKIAGGAQMFQFTSNQDSMRIGPRNVEAVKVQLKKLNIPLLAEDTGGNSGRTIEFNPQTSKLQIRTVNQGVKDL